MNDLERFEARQNNNNHKQRLPRVGAADLIARDLVQDIVSGVLPRGGKLPAEKELAQQYGASQPTIREAMRALSMLGLVEARHGSGVYISNNSAQLVARSLSTLIQFNQIGILDVLDVRASLGRHAVERAAEHATDEDIQAVADALKSVEEEQDPRAVVIAIADFQATLSAASHNPLLTEIESYLVALIMHFQFAVYGSRGPAFWKRWTSESAPFRRQIVTALQRRAKRPLVTAMNAYLSAQRRHFIENPKLTSARLSPTWAEITQGILLGRLKPDTPATQTKKNNNKQNGEDRK
jgi:GntR family transcriptional repressor for pyruvate dehydrogenase complex